MDNQTAKKLLIEAGISSRSIIKIKGEGINSQVFKVITLDSRACALKIYKPISDSDKRERLKNEITFINYIRRNATSHARSVIPQIITSSESGNWSLFSWLDGSHPTENNLNIQTQIADFIHCINIQRNAIFSEKNSFNIGCAADRIASIHSLPNQISKRIKTIKRVNKFLECNEWITDVLEPNFKKEVVKLQAKTKSNYWSERSLREDEIISPSDNGLHNTLLHNKILQFIDFEYGGTDDLSKYCADFILHPNHIMTRAEANIFISMLKKRRILNSDEWLQRLEDIKPLIIIKWCLIILGAKSSEKYVQLRRLRKAKHYLKKTTYFDLKS